MPVFSVRGPVALPAAGGVFVVGNHISASGNDGGTTAAIDTTGATLIVAAVGVFNAVVTTLSDNKSNTWVTAPPTNQHFTTVDLVLYYCANPTVGTGHTFTIAGTSSFSVVNVCAFSGGLNATPFDVENGTGNFNSDPVAGSISPTADNEVVIAAVRVNRTLTSIDSPFIIIENHDFGGTDGALAYSIQTTATARNPHWVFTGGGDTSWCAVIASFKSS